jgi:thioredoxin-related protein
MRSRTTPFPLVSILLAAVMLMLFAPSSAAATESLAPDGPLPSPYAIDIPKWFTETLLDFREDVADAAKDGKRVLLYFGQDGCPYCTALMQVNFSQRDIVETTRSHFVAIALNIWGDREVTWVDGTSMTEKELGHRLKVQYTPTLLFLDEKGAIALRQNGYLPPDRFRLALDYVRQRRETDEAFTDYVARYPRHDRDGQGRTTAATIGVRATDLRPVRGSKPLLVVVEQRFCRECDELYDIASARGEVRQLLARFRVVRVDFLGSRGLVAPSGKRMRERDWARALQIGYTPTLVFFDRDGNEVFRTDGYVRPFHLASSLDYVASGAYRSEPSFQRFVRTRAERASAAGRPVDLWR